MTWVYVLHVLLHLHRVTGMRTVNKYTLLLVHTLLVDVLHALLHA
jgi:hypothetical protein